MRQASMEDAPPIEDEDEEPTSEHVDGLELIFGRGKSGYKDVYPHRKEALPLPPRLLPASRS